MISEYTTPQCRLLLKKIVPKPTAQPIKTTETSGITSHGHMTHQEKDRIFRGSGDEDLLTLSPIYRDVIARVRKCSPIQWQFQVRWWTFRLFQVYWNVQSLFSYHIMLAQELHKWVDICSLWSNTYMSEPHVWHSSILELPYLSRFLSVDHYTDITHYIHITPYTHREWSYIWSRVCLEK